MKLIRTLALAGAFALVATTSKADIAVNFLTFNALNSTLGFANNVDGVTPLGSGFSAQLYVGLTAGSLAAIGSPMPYLNGNQGHISAGVVNATSVTIFGGSSGAYQLKAWNNNGGAITSFEAAVAAGGIAGQSAIVGIGGTVQTAGFSFGGPPAGGGTSLPPPDVNLHPSFSVAVIPEPTLMTLGLLGAAGLFLRRRRE